MYTEYVSAHAMGGTATALGKLAVTEIQSVEEIVTRSLRDAILRGELLPGDRLRQEELAVHLGVSRIPLRDALRRLEAEGLVRIDKRRGAQVARLTAEDVREIYELRALLEERCIRYAIRNLDVAGAAKLIAMSERMDRLTPSVAEASGARRAFYDALYAYSGRERMRQIVMRLRDDAHRYHVLKHSHGSKQQHAEIRECIRRRDAERAATLIKEHLHQAGRDLAEILERERTASATS